jgi:large subunit ribosomal protein L23
LKLQLLTEKSIIELENNKYTFKVDINLSKTQIKQIIEELFDIKVLNINTCRIAKHVSNSNKNYKAFYKKAILTIESNKVIQFF